MLDKEIMAMHIMAALMVGYIQKGPSLSSSAPLREHEETVKEITDLADLAGYAAQKLHRALAME